MLFRIRGPGGLWALLGAVLGLILFMPVHAAEEKQTTNSPIDDVVKKVNAEQDEELYRQPRPTSQKFISFADFRNVLRSVRARSGTLRTWTEQASEGETKVYRVQGEKRSEIVKIALDKEGRISLLIFTPVSSRDDFGRTLFGIIPGIFLIAVSHYVIRRLTDRGARQGVR